MPSLSPTQPGAPAPASLASSRLTDAVHRYSVPLTRYATKILGDGELARDVVQDTFLRLHESGADVAPDATRAWLYRVCRNRALDLKRRGRWSVGLDGVPEPRVEPSGERARVLSELNAMLQDLPEHKQQVAALRFRDGRSYKQISAETGLSVSHVGTVLHDVTNTLRGRVALGGLLLLLLALAATLWSQPEPLEATPVFPQVAPQVDPSTPLELLPDERHVEGPDDEPKPREDDEPRRPELPKSRHTFESER